jgi:hypothetical protein
MTQDCPRCTTTLAALHSLRGQVLVVVAILNAELEKATMSRRDLLEQTRARLDSATETAG